MRADGLRVKEKCFVVEEVLIFSSTETNKYDDFRKCFGTCTVLSGQNQGKMQIDKIDDGGFTEFLALA